MKLVPEAIVEMFQREREKVIGIDYIALYVDGTQW